jgi:hypothetical protein
MNDLREATLRRPTHSDLWQDVCGSVMLHKTAEGITVVFERAVGKVAQSFH